MLRAIVLVLCLASAGGIATYSYYTREDAAEIYTVPAPTTAPPAPKTASSRSIAPDDQAALARELQRELKRVGCYTGEINGVWSPQSRLAMKTFVEHVNAALPVAKPDPVLLSLVQGHRDRVCGIGCPPGQTALPGGACVPDAVAAADMEPGPDAKSDTKSDAGKTGATLGAAAAGAGAGMALAGSKQDANAKAKDGKAQDAKAGAPEAGAESPDGKPPKRPRRTKRPPKIVSDFMKVFGQ